MYTTTDYALAIPPKPQTMLYRNLLPLGELVLLDGYSGTGKTMLMAGIIGEMTRQQQNVLAIISRDQHLSFTQFLSRMQANHEYLLGISFKLYPEVEASPTLQYLFFLQGHIERYHPSLLYVDDLEEMLSEYGESTAFDMSYFWKELAKTAAKHQCTIVISRRNGLHESRSYGLYTRLGSTFAPFGITMGCHPIDPAQRILTIARNQTGPVGHQVHMQFNSTGQFTLTDAEPHQHVRPAKKPATWLPLHKYQHTTEEIYHLVTQLLMHGPRLCAEVRQVLKDSDYTDHAIDYALSRIKLNRIRIGHDNYYEPCANMRHKQADIQTTQASVTPEQYTTTVEPAAEPNRDILPARTPAEESCTLTPPETSFASPSYRQAG